MAGVVFDGRAFILDWGNTLPERPEVPAYPATDPCGGSYGDHHLVLLVVLDHQLHKSEQPAVSWGFALAVVVDHVCDP